MRFMDVKNKLNILIVCEHASNKFGGEAMLPFNYFRLLSQSNHNTYLITHSRVKQDLEQLTELEQGNIFYIPDTKLHKALYKITAALPHRLGLATSGFLTSLVTQYYQRKIAKRVIRDKAIDVVHEVAPVSARQPSAMFSLKTPVIIGPLNGGMQFPPAFQKMSGPLETITYYLIRIFNTSFNFVIPGKRYADIILVANQRTANALPGFRKGKTYELVENGVFSVADKANTSQKTTSVNVIYVGRLVDWKCVDILIDAVANTESKATLTIVGDGPDREALESYAKNKQIDSIQFTGMIPHTAVNQYYDDADIFVLPSVRECGGAVVLEAMSRGLPVIATDWGGPADYIGEGSGYLIPPDSRQNMVRMFADKIDELSADPKLRKQIGENAIKRVKQHFLWSNKIDTITSYYQQVCNK